MSFSGYIQGGLGKSPKLEFSYSPTEMININIVISHRAKLDKCEFPAFFLVDIPCVVVHVRLVALHWHAFQDHLQHEDGQDDNEQSNQQ